MASGKPRKRRLFIWEKKGLAIQKRMETPPVLKRKRGELGKKARKSVGKEENHDPPTPVVGKRSNGKPRLR
jgi:hypothetical protein